MALNDTETPRLWGETKNIECLASALDIGIMVYDRDDRLIAASSQFLRFFDVPRELLKPGARLRDLFNATYDAGARVLGSLDGKPRYVSREDWVAERIAIHWRERYESVERLADGRWVRLCKRRMPDGILLATIQDVSEQKRKDEEMAEVLKKAELVQLILDNLATPVVVKDSELRYIMVNDAFCRIPGLHRKQIIGKKAADLVSQELAERFESVESKVLQSGVAYETPEDIYSFDGTAIPVVTRVRRSGTPGNYYITISFDDVSAVTFGNKVEADYRSGPKPAAVSRPSTPSETGAQEPTPSQASKGRILVVDEDRHRSAAQVAALKREGFDAVATASVGETLAFLEAAREMKLAISEIKISARLSQMISIDAARNHPVLEQALRAKLPVSTSARSAPEKTADAPVPSLITASGSSEEEVVASARTAVRPPGKPVSQEPAPSPVRERIRVLVAEDNDVNQIVFEQILEGMDVDFRIVSNGQEAVAAWSAAAPDLILMDVSMPVMNGLQATQAIRDAEAKAGTSPHPVPVIAVTAHAMTGDRERCLAAGMNDYLSKPVSPEKLEAIIAKWVNGPQLLKVAG
jgi:PAS domain S-box-containing protein